MKNFFKWQKEIFLLLIFFTISIIPLGIYVLHTSPHLSIESDLPISFAEINIRKISHIELSPEFFNRLPEFFTSGEETKWWQKHKDIDRLLKENNLIPVEISRNNEEISREIMGRITPLPISEVIKKTWLIYLAAVFYLISALSVFKKHQNISGVLLAFFLLSAGLYHIASAPVVNRTITLAPLYFRIFTTLIYISAGGMITLIHFAFVFPKEKDLLKRLSWLPWIPYGYFFITIILYLARITAFGTTFPLFCLWIFIMIGGFIHSYMKEEDLFLKRQISLNILAPIIASSIFVFLYLLPGVLKISTLNFTYLALVSLILPFALPSAIDNLQLYQQKIEMEKNSQNEREKIRQDLHDNLSNDLMNIKFLSEVGETEETEKIREIIKTIKETVLRNIEEIRNFLWIMDTEEEGLDGVISHFRSYNIRYLDPLKIDIKLNTLLPQSQKLAPSLRSNLLKIYKEAMSNIIKHSEASKVAVDLSLNQTNFEMKITDNGKGLSPDIIQNSTGGIKNMKRRAEDLGGILNVSSEKGKYTMLHLCLPAKYLI